MLIRRLAAMIALLLVAAACGDDGSAPTESGTAPPPPTSGAPPAAAGSLRAAAGDRLIGAAVSPGLLADDAEYAALLAAEFNSLTPESVLKWDQIHPEPDRYEFGPTDDLVEFAEANGMAVKGHNLLWHQSGIHSTPDWVLEIDDPDQLSAVVDEHIRTVVGRYAGRIDRWDVVNEPLVPDGDRLAPTHFEEVLGPDYVADAFRSAHAADPHASLWLNEHSVEFLPAKADALVDLTAGLLADGVPVHGVGLQLHLITGPPDLDMLTDLVERLRALDVEVAVTELDLPIPEDQLAADPSAARQQQADDLGAVLDACFVAGCADVTVWGVDDGHSWLLDFLGGDTEPLLFTAAYEPKPVTAAVAASLMAH